MAELMPHYKARMPSYWLAPKGNSVAETEVPHPFAGNFPEGYNPSDGDTQVLDPLGGIAGPVLPSTDITAITAAVAPAPAVISAANCIPPATTALLISEAPTASPLTLWTVGQHVILGDGSVAHWDSAAWAAGLAPA